MSAPNISPAPGNWGSPSGNLISHGGNGAVVWQLSPDASGAGPRTLKQRRIKRHPEALFHACRPIMAAGVGILRDGRSLCPVFATHVSPPPKPRTEVADSITAKESIMAKATPKGDPRPKSVPTLPPSYT